MKLKQFILHLFIGLVLINLAHNTIPHHHHLNNIPTHEGCDDHGFDITDTEAGDPFTHCHAFNGMEYFPVTENIKVIPLKHLGNDFFSLPTTRADVKLGTPFGICTFTDLPDHYRGLDRRGTSLRAPPSNC